MRDIEVVDDLPARIERRRREDQQGRIDGKREHQRHRRIDGRELQRFLLLGHRLAIGAGLDDARVQIEIVRHHRRTDDPEPQIEHVRVGEEIGGRRKAADHLAPVGVGHRDLHEEARRDNAHHGDDEGFDPAEALGLQPQDQEHIERGDEDADLERNAEDQIEADRRADHLGEVRRADRQLRQRPQRPAQPARERVAAGLRQILARCDGEART